MKDKYAQSVVATDLRMGSVLTVGQSRKPSAINLPASASGYKQYLSLFNDSSSSNESLPFICIVVFVENVLTKLIAYSKCQFCTLETTISVFDIFPRTAEM